MTSVLQIDPSLVLRSFKATWNSQRRLMQKAKANHLIWPLLKNQRIRLRTQRAVIFSQKNTHSEVRPITWPKILTKLPTWIEIADSGHQTTGRVVRWPKIMPHRIRKQSYIKPLSARLQVIKTSKWQARGKLVNVTRTLQSQSWTTLLSTTLTCSMQS